MKLIMNSGGSSDYMLLFYVIVNAMHLLYSDTRKYAIKDKYE